MAGSSERLLRCADIPSNISAFMYIIATSGSYTHTHTNATSIRSYIHYSATSRADSTSCYTYTHPLTYLAHRMGHYVRGVIHKIEMETNLILTQIATIRYAHAHNYTTHTFSTLNDTRATLWMYAHIHTHT